MSRRWGPPRRTFGVESKRVSDRSFPRPAGQDRVGGSAPTPPFNAALGCAAQAGTGLLSYEGYLPLATLSPRLPAMAWPRSGSPMDRHAGQGAFP
jgi:hypothetical protein